MSTADRPERIPASESDRRRRIFLAKLAVTVLLLGAAFYVADLRDTAQRINDLGMGSCLAVLVMLCLQQVIGALRWHVILNRMGESVDLLRSAQIYFTGNVAGLVLVTSLGGLSIRAVLLSRAGTTLRRAVYSLAFERLFAVGALLLCFMAGLAVFGAAMGWGGLADYRLALLVAVGALLVAGAGARLLNRRALPGTAELLHLTRETLTDPRSFGLNFALSLLILGLGFAAVAVIAVSLEIGVPLLLLLSVQPVIAFLAALPVSLGGWGLRESGMILGLGLLGVAASDALAVSLIFGVLGVIAVLVTSGAVLVLSFYGKPGARRSGILE